MEYNIGLMGFADENVEFLCFERPLGIKRNEFRLRTMECSSKLEGSIVLQWQCMKGAKP